MHNSGIASKESAVGMIVARGIKYHKIPITGRYVIKKLNQLCSYTNICCRLGTLGWNYSQGVGLYLSYDGGFSWREVCKQYT